MTKNIPWQSWEKAKLAELHESGLTFDECAVYFDRTPDACRSMYNHTIQSEAAKLNQGKYTTAETLWAVNLGGRRFDDPGLTVKSHTTGKSPVYSAYRPYSLTGNAAQMCAK